MDKAKEEELAKAIELNCQQVVVAVDQLRDFYVANSCFTQDKQIAYVQFLTRFKESLFWVNEMLKGNIVNTESAGE